MAELILTERYKFAGDIYPRLIDIGFTSDEAVSFLNNITDSDVVPKSEVVPLITLIRHLEAQNTAHDQALQDKARECNMAIDKICLEHRKELAEAKSEVAREIIAEILTTNTIDIDGFFTMHETDLYDLKKKYTEDQT